MSFFDRSTFSAIPPVTKHIIIINFIIWLVMMVVPRHLGVDLTALAGLHYFTASDFNPLQLITYMFMHSTQGFSHILFNMFTLFVFGVTLERVMGSVRFLIYYISCGIGAALIQELTWAIAWPSTLLSMVHAAPSVDADTVLSLLPADQVEWFFNSMVTIGASGAIYGVLLAFGMIFPNRPLYLMFIPVPIKAKWMVLGYGVIELLIGLSQYGADNVAHFAHLGGMIFGFFIILWWKRKGLIHGDIYY